MAFLGSSDNIELDLNLSSLKCSTLLFSIAPGREDLNTDNNTKNMSGKGRWTLICSCDTFSFCSICNSKWSLSLVSLAAFPSVNCFVFISNFVCLYSFRLREKPRILKKERQETCLAMYPVTRHVCLILKRYTQAARLGGTYVLLQSRHELIYSEGWPLCGKLPQW